MKSLLLWLFSHRTLALIRWDIHFLKIRLLNVVLFRNSKVKKILKNGVEGKFLNLGSGPRGIDDGHWINVDGFKDKNVHYLCDFNRPLPFEPETFDGIFCEHVLEHFDYENGKKLMTECKGYLRTGGVIRIIVPDGKKMMNNYFKDPSSVVNYKQAATGYPMEAINIWFYQRYEHQCIYDAEYLIGMLLSCGYSKASQCQFKESAFGKAAIVIDDDKYSWESLYVEAVK